MRKSFRRPRASMVAQDLGFTKYPDTFQAPPESSVGTTVSTVGPAEKSVLYLMTTYLPVGAFGKLSVY